MIYKDKNNQLRWIHNNTLVKKPSVMFDIVTGTLHKYGEKDSVNQCFDNWKERDITGLIINDIIVITLDLTLLNNDELLDCFNNMYSNTGYCKLFYKKRLQECLNKL